MCLHQSTSIFEDLISRIRSVEVSLKGFAVVLDRFSGWTKAGVWHSSSFRFAVFVLWLVAVSIFLSEHAFWRDEVRVLSIATQGTLLSMLESLRGEGHPALWYLLVRLAHFSAGSSALWILSVSIASLAALLLLFGSPFGWPFVALFLFGRLPIFEYSVMARNYGISMLLMFLFAACYPRYRDRTVVLGLVLFLLANAHALSALLVGAFIFFYLADVVSIQGFRWTPVLKVMLLNSAIAVGGLLVCFASIYPPTADAIPIGMHSEVGLGAAIFEPARTFGELVRIQHWNIVGFGNIGIVVMSVVMFGSILGLIRSPAAVIAALASLIGLSIFFVVVYPGTYRHQGLWLVFLISMYWVTHDRSGNAEGSQSIAKFGRANKLGTTLMVLLVAAQLLGTVSVVADAGRGLPLSRSRDLSEFIMSRPDLRKAAIIADPDYLVEALAYYIDNPTYLMREQRFGNVVTFTRGALLSLDLDDFLSVAKKLNQERGEPVIILMTQTLDPAHSAKDYSEGYNWKLSVTPDQARRFLAYTRLLVHFPPARSDERYDVYLFDQR